MKTKPSWVGEKTHTWNAQIGGGSWYQAENILKRVAEEVMDEYPRPVLVGLREDVRSPYRFYDDSWDPQAPTHNDWPDRCATEHTLKIFEKHNSEFIWSMPTPNKFAANPWLDSVPKGSASLWQTPDYYSAYYQYLCGRAQPTQVKKMKKTAYPFFTDASCKTINKESELAVSRNWANLRAKRGHFAPYPIQSVILGIEPYGDAQETMQVNKVDSGKLYGETVLKFLNAFRARQMFIRPLGLNIAGFFPMTDFSRSWFKQLFDVLGKDRSKFSILDLHHLYQNGLASGFFNRTYPGLINTTPIGGAVQSPGWQNYWVPKSQWPEGVDYSDYMWMWNDARAALRMIGENPDRWKIGCSEHGMAVKSPFSGNDLGGAIHWGLWLGKCMLYNVQWDMNWVLSDMGYSHAQIQVKDGHLTRTPGHYVYKLAQQFIGLEHLSNAFQSPTVTPGTTKEGGTYISPDVVVRTFKQPGKEIYSLFVINQGTTPATITGWEKWMVPKWRILKADSFDEMNPIGNPWHEETVKTFGRTNVQGTSLVIPPISVNLIELQ